jgi:isopentenyl-diphosphate delta-isomerase
MEDLENESLESANQRKQSHLDLTFEAQSVELDDRFYYEPMLSSHPNESDKMTTSFGEKQMDFPIWISSMTGGTSTSGAINRMLAKTAAKFGLGMGLGSCRIILEDDTYFEDFNLRPILGKAVPFYANLGIAQVEKLIVNKQTDKIKTLIDKLGADGLIVHVNPIQEWLQAEGDAIHQSPIITIEELIFQLDKPIIVKEVGQGFGPASIGALLQLPLQAIDFAANGGTNFAKLELLRNEKLQSSYKDMAALGHSAEEMVDFLNTDIQKMGSSRKCNQVIISGGIKNFLDGYYCINRANLSAVYGQAAAFLKHANESQQSLDNYTEQQINGLKMAQRYLRIKG